MVQFDKLMSLSEAATGYSGGSYTDEMPGMDLSECISAFPVFMMEAAMELSDLTSDFNNSMVEAATDALNGGAAMDEAFDAISEASIEGLKNHAKNIFEKILRFIRSVIAKLKTFIDKKFKTGHQLYEKYKDSPNIKNASGDTFKDLSFDGYKFKDHVFPEIGKYVTNIESLVSEAGKVGASPASFNSPVANEDDAKGKQAVIDKAKEMPGATEIAATAASKLTGMKNLPSDGWVPHIKKELYGEKISLKYGSDFTLASVIEPLKNPSNLNEIMDDYRKLERYTSEYKKKVEELMSSVKKGNRKNEEPVKKGNEMTAEYGAMYLKAVDAVYSAVGKVKDIRFGYESARLDQATRIFGKMITYKAGKEAKKEDSIEEAFGDFGDFADMFI